MGYIMISRKYKLVNDKKWLLDKYVTEKLSVHQIGKLVGCKSCNTVRQALKHFGIELRGQSEAQRIKQKDQPNINESVLTGCLLGDGSLLKYNKSNEESCPHFGKGNKHYEHVLYVARFFYDKPEEHISRQSWITNDREFIVYNFRTCAIPELQTCFAKWYPKSNNFKKVVPQDIVLDETSLLHWFLDDGSTYLTSKKYLNLVLCTDNFTRDEVEMLCGKLNDTFNLTARVGRNDKWKEGKDYHRIYLANGTAHDFLDIIGKPPVRCFEYKWRDYF